MSYLSARRTTRRGRSSLLAGALAVSVVAALAGCGSDSSDSASASGASSAPTTVRIGVLNGSDTGLVLAQTTGDFDRELAAVDATPEFAGPFPAFVPAAEAIKAGSVDITIGGLLSWVGGVAANPDLVVFAKQPNQGTNEGIVATKGSGVTDVQGLKGKKVAINKAGTGEYLLLKALAKEGLTIDDVTPVYLPPTDAATAFQSGKVDAWATWGNFFAAASTIDGATVVTTGEAVGSKNDTIYVVDRKFLDAHPDVVAAVYRALDGASKAAAADRDILRAAWKKDKLSPEVVAVFEKVPPATIEPVTPAVQAAWQTEADFWTANKVIPKSVDVKASTVDLSSKLSASATPTS